MGKKGHQLTEQQRLPPPPMSQRNIFFVRRKNIFPPTRLTLARLCIKTHKDSLASTSLRVLSRGASRQRWKLDLTSGRTVVQAHKASECRAVTADVRTTSMSEKQHATLAFANRSKETVSCPSIGKGTLQQ